jgi:hypothetical protein
MAIPGAMRSALTGKERVEHLYAGACNILRISGDENQSVHKCRRSKHAINGRQTMLGIQSAPGFSDFMVDGKDPVGKALCERRTVLASRTGRQHIAC